MIDFSSTAQNSLNEIEYFNTRGQIVKSYPLSKLELWIIENDLLNTGDIEEIAECDSPFSKHFTLVNHEVYESLNDYIDNNWKSVCEKFYSAMNPNEFKSMNTPQETLKAV